MDQILELNTDLEATPEPKPEPTTLTPVEQEAQQMGWVPKDQWKGAEEDWVPAKAYVKYGSLEADLKRERADKSHKEKVIKSMKDHYLNVKEDAKKEILDTFKRQKRDAIKAEDYTEVARLDVQIDELTDNLDRKFVARDRQIEEVTAPANTPPPEFYEWNRKNSWYAMNSGNEMTVEADALAVAYAQKNPDKSYTDMLNYVSDKMRKLYPEKFEPTPVKEKGGDDVNEPPQTNGASRRPKSKLTDAEKAAADAFGIPYDEYAKDLGEYDKRKGWA